MFSCAVFFRRSYMKTTKIRILVECAIMVAFSTVLSLITLGKLPAGGSITLASMLPVVIISYRHGLKWGMGTALTVSFIQLLLGLSNFSYFTTWYSIVVLALLDYVVAYCAYGATGLFRRAIKKQGLALVLGAFFASLLRYLCHVISGATIWAGVSIPNEAIMLYSLSYNATYMVPDTIILCLVTAYVGSMIDFRRAEPTRMKRQRLSPLDTGLGIGAGAAVLGGTIYDVVALFTALQAEGGEFDITRLGEAPWSLMGIVSAACLAVAALLAAAIYVRNRKARGANDEA